MEIKLGEATELKPCPCFLLLSLSVGAAVGAVSPALNLLHFQRVGNKGKRMKEVNFMLKEVSRRQGFRTTFLGTEAFSPSLGLYRCEATGRYYFPTSSH